MKKEIVFLDMDNVLVDFQSGLNKVSDSVKAQYAKDENGKPHMDDIPHLFSLMDVMPGAHEAVEKLKDKYDLYILSTAPWNNPSAWADKLEWVKKHFDDIKRTDENGKEVPIFHKRLILSHHKDFCNLDGAFLVDDRDRHGAKNFGHRWLHFGPEGEYKDWNEVVDYLLHRHDGMLDMEYFCHHRGFTFHSHGHGKWGAFPYYSFEQQDDGVQTYGISYTPGSNEVKIETPTGTFKGRVDSVDQFRQLVGSMGIDFAAVIDKAAVQTNSKLMMERKCEIANRIASRVKARYGFRDEKCRNMAMQGDWWNDANRLTLLSNRYVDDYAAQVLADIERGKID